MNRGGWHTNGEGYADNIAGIAIQTIGGTKEC